MHAQIYTLQRGNTQTHTRIQQYDPVSKVALRKMALLAKWHPANWDIKKKKKIQETGTQQSGAWQTGMFL